MLRRPLAAIVTGALTASLMIAGTLPAQAAAVEAPLTHDAVVDSDGDLRLSWESTPGASAYKVEVATTPTFDSGTVIAGVETYAVSWVPTTVLSATEARTLYWRVAAFSSGTSATSRGSYSPAQGFDTDAMATPELVRPSSGATVNYPTPVTFGWEPVPGAVSYTLQYSPDSSFPTEAVRPLVTTTATSYTPDVPLERMNGGEIITWNWRVRANFYSGSATELVGRWSGGSTFTIDWTSAASKPSLLTPANWTSPSNPAISDVVFSWTPVPGAASYKVVVGVSKDSTLVTGVLAGAGGTTSTTTFVPEVALLDQNYYWQVIAYDTAGRAGVPSEIRQFQKQWGAQTSPTVAVGAATTYPVPNVGGTDMLSAPEMSLDTFQLSWQPVARATMYEVEVVPLNGDPRLTCHTASTSVTVIEEYIAGAGLPSALDGADDCLWTQTEAERIQPDQTYRWRVRAVDYTGAATTTIKTFPLPTGTVVSDWSDPEDAGHPDRARYVRVTARATTTATGSEPDATAFAAQYVSGQPSPVFSWNPTLNADGYDVTIATNSAMTTQVATIRTQGTVLRATGVFDDNTTSLPYYWQVRPFIHIGNAIAYIADGSSAHPSWIKGSTATDLVGVTNPVAVSADGTTVLSWRPQGASAPLDGGSRGYLVTILNADGTEVGSAKVEYPSYVARNPSTRKPLKDGSYKFTVAPLDANGTAGRAFAPPRDFTVTTPKPVAGSSVVGSSSATLRWTTPVAATRYEVEYWNLSTPGTKTKVGGASLNKQTAMTVKDLAPGSYGWHVRSADEAGGFSPWSTDATVVIATRSPLLTTGGGTVLSTAHRVLDWDPVPGASRYIVQWAATSGGVASAVGYETVATSFALPTSVAFGTTYSWRVRAVYEKFNASTGSTRVSLGTSAESTFGTRTVPGIPTIQTPTVSGNGLNVTWTLLAGSATGTETGITGYVVRYRVKATPENEWTLVYPSSSTVAASKLLTGLEHSTTYEVGVSALSDQGQGQWSATVSKATAGPPGAPTNLVLTPGANTLKVAWKLPANGGSALTGIMVRYQRTTGGDWTEVPLLPSTTSYTITGLTANAGYLIEVTASNAIGTGPAATADAVVSPPPGAPTGITYTRGNAFVQVSWKAPVNTGGSALTGFVVEIREYNPATTTWSAWTTRTTVSASTLTYKATGLTNGTTYGLRVRAKTALGTGSPSSVAQATPAKPPTAPSGMGGKSGGWS